QTMNEFGPKYKSPGGEAVGFYSSLRLRTEIAKKITRTIKVAGKEVKRAVGVKILVEVFKSSIWKPFRTAPVTIIFDYGIDNIRENLQFIKDYTKNTTYTVNGYALSASMKEAIILIENGGGMEQALKNEVIDLWESIDHRFNSTRKTKIR
ncbi:MAG TPA: hypothetical protein ENH82_12130, partial [bacterium]|nr:hypothetical protein [bacterium]